MNSDCSNLNKSVAKKVPRNVLQLLLLLKSITYFNALSKRKQIYPQAIRFKVIAPSRDSTVTIKIFLSSIEQTPPCYICTAVHLLPTQM